MGPGAGIQLSANNPHHPNRLVVRASVPAPSCRFGFGRLIRGCRAQFAGHHGAYTYDMVWYSDDGGETYVLAKNATGGPLQIWGQDEIALAETPEGGVITSTRNEDYHKGYNKANTGCNCRGKARSTDGGAPHAYWYRRWLLGNLARADRYDVWHERAGPGAARPCLPGDDGQRRVGWLRPHDLPRESWSRDGQGEQEPARREGLRHRSPLRRW